MKHFALLLLSLIFFSFSSCTKKDERILVQKNLEEALYYQKNGNLEYALKFYRLAKENSKNQDSVLYWSKAILGEGEIFMMKSDFKAAKRDFSELLYFAQRKELLNEECIAWQRLGQVALSQYEPQLADSCYRQALRLVKSLKKAPLPYLEEEALIAKANSELVHKGVISDSIYKKLLVLHEFDAEEIKVASLKLLAVHAVKMATAPGGKNWLSMYITAKENLTTRQFQNYSDLQEQEKAQLVLERDKQARDKQLTLFISLVSLALVICVGLYIMVSYRRRHELDRIQRILAEKEVEIYRLEQQTDELNNLQSLLKESEKAVEELERKNKELDELRLELKDREDQVDELKEHFKDINQMREQIRRKEKELEEIKANLLSERFYRNSTIAARVPTPENPNAPVEKDFKFLFHSGNNQAEFLADYNKNYGNFATRLQELNPKLTNEDLLYCCLFRMNARTTDVASMLGVSKNSVSMRRKRIEEKMEEK